MGARQSSIHPLIHPSPSQSRPGSAAVGDRCQMENVVHTRKPRRASRLRRALIWSAVGILGLLSAALAVHVWANPQWCKTIYIFQKYVWPRDYERVDRPPPSYTGVWRSWYTNGVKASELWYAGGVPHGKGTQWWRNGQKSREGRFANGLREGKWHDWAEKGQKTRERNYKDGKLDGAWLEWDEKGELICEKLFCQDRLVTQDQRGQTAP